MTREKPLEKLKNLTLKKRELETLLKGLGFEKSPGKGSHVKWVKGGLPPIVIATHDKEIKSYQLRQVIAVLKIGGLV